MVAKFKVGNELQLKMTFPERIGGERIFHPKVTVLNVITEECSGGVQVWYGCRCWMTGAESQIIRFSEVELEEIPEW